MISSVRGCCFFLCRRKWNEYISLRVHGSTSYAFVRNRRCYFFRVQYFNFRWMAYIFVDIYTLMMEYSTIENSITIAVVISSFFSYVLFNLPYPLRPSHTFTQFFVQIALCTHVHTHRQTLHSFPCNLTNNNYLTYCTNVCTNMENNKTNTNKPLLTMMHCNENNWINLEKVLIMIQSILRYPPYQMSSTKFVNTLFLFQFDWILIVYFAFDIWVS